MQSKTAIKMNRKSKSDKIIAHIDATIDFFNNTPKTLRHSFDKERFFLELVSIDVKGNPRTLNYFCYTVEEFEAVKTALVEKYSVEVVEVAL